MFNVVVDRKKRRVWTAGAIALSVAAHLLVLGEIVAAANRPTWPDLEVCLDCGMCLDCGWDRFPPPPPLPWPGQPAPANGKTTESDARGVVAPGHGELPPNPGDTPEPPDAGDGALGAVTGIAPTSQPTTTGGADPVPDDLDGGPDEIDVEKLPQLLDPREAQRLLQRVYPDVLRDAGVTGHTTVLLLVGRSGEVEPGSVIVQETTHEAFREAAVRAAERFRFRPARVNGQPVAVMISLPIEWTIQR